MKSKDILDSDESKRKEITNFKVNSISINISLENKQNNNKNNNNFNINKNTNNKIINNEIKEKGDINQDKIYVVMNKNTEKLMDSKRKTDLIQCALEYNSYLIENLIKEKNDLSPLEYNAALNRLYQNLSVLSESFENYENKYKLINTNVKINKDSGGKNNQEFNKSNEINNLDRIYSNSITNINMELPL